jgi:DNA-binding NarL/FixJ family response regulator
MAPPSEARRRILVVDDHSVVRRGIAALLASEPDLEICAEAGSCAEARTLFEAARPDLLLVDVSLRDGNGLDLIGDLIARRPEARALVLTMHDETVFARRAAGAGAAGYVMKDQADECLVDAIRTVLDGGRFFPSDPGEPGSGPAVGGVASLTDREREVFERIGRGWTTRQIAAGFGLSARTVEVHRAHIKRKLGCESSAGLVREAVRWVEPSGAPAPETA